MTVRPKTGKAEVNAPYLNPKNTFPWGLRLGFSQLMFSVLTFDDGMLQIVSRKALPHICCGGPAMLTHSQTDLIQWLTLPEAPDM